MKSTKSQTSIHGSCETSNSWLSSNRKSKQPVDWKIVRTFVGRTELLSPEREKALEKVVTDYARGDMMARHNAERALAAWGRFAVPYLHRVLALTEDAEIRASVRKQLAALEVRR